MPIDLVGQRFGNLTVLEKGGKTKQGTSWGCLCDCGSATKVTTGRLRIGHTKSCGCLRGNLYGDIEFSIPGKSAFTQLFHRYRRGAKVRNISFYLTKEEFRKIVEKNCFYCGRKPFQTTPSKTSSEHYVYIGIDRDNSSLGYTTHNCIPCCVTCNRMKLDMTRDDFLSACLRVTSFQKESLCQSKLASELN